MQPSTLQQDKHILTVSDLNRQARLTIEERFNQVWVVGELSNFARPRSGHWYFSLKDDRAQVRCAMFANRNRGVRLQPGDGQLVMVRGRVSLYEGRGDFQVIVEHMEAAGEGALRQAFDQLKVKLAAEGLFDTDNKRPLPALPRHIVVVTSPSGAAIRDILAVWQRRYPSLKVTLVPSQVQGEGAEQQLVHAIQRAGQLPADTLLLTRGGGSLEDLWSFNLESVARALANCPLPTVSAIGHEIDVTICDFVADLRAPTPSAAAELMVPDQADLQRRVDQHRHRLRLLWQHQHERLSMLLAHLHLQLVSPQHLLETTWQRLDDSQTRLQHTLLHHLSELRMKLHTSQRQLHAVGPTAQLQRATTSVQQLYKRLMFAEHQLHKTRQVELTNLSRMLHSVSPLPTLARGFAVVRDPQGRVVTDIGAVTEGQNLRTYLQDGMLEATVTAVHPEQGLAD